MGNIITHELSKEELELFSMEVDEEFNPINERDRAHARMKYRLR